MKNDKKENKKDTPENKAGGKAGDQFAYPPSEDIYNNAQEEQDLDPEDPTHLKAPNEVPGANNEKSFRNDVAGDDLDITGAVEDGQLEATGSEDEENDYYSLGGDDHDDLEEDKGDIDTP